MSNSSINQKYFSNVILTVLFSILSITFAQTTLCKAKNDQDKINNNDKYNKISLKGKTKWKAYSGDNFTIKYPGEIFTLFETEKYARPLHAMNATKVTLLSSSRAGNIGKKECIFYKGGPKEVCDARSESGISLYETDGPISEYTSTIESKKKIRVTIGANKFIKTSKKFPDGTETDTYYLSLNKNRTLIVFRQVWGAAYVPKQEDGFPNEDLFKKVLSTLVIK